MDSGKGKDRFGRFSWSKSVSKDVDVKLKLFKKNDNKDMRLVPILTRGKADFNQFMRLRNQLVIATENFGRGENLSPVPIPTISRDVDEELRLLPDYERTESQQEISRLKRTLYNGKRKFV